MTNRNKLALATVSMLAFASSCKDKDETCVAGQGGDITLLAQPRHHGAKVKPVAAWLKFNTQDSPGASESDYDLIVAGDTSEDHVHISGLKCGSYYIFMRGIDTANLAVKGGIPYKLAEAASGEVKVTVPVTEE